MHVLFLSALVCLASVPTKTHRVVVELNTSGDTALATVIGNVTNLKKAFAPELVEVEVVCEGNGMDLLIAKENHFATKIEKMSKSGVAFRACNNTLRGRGISAKRLFPFVKVVDAGIAEVVRKQEQGWTYLKR